MLFIVDAQLPPQLAGWIDSEFGIKAVAVRDLGQRDASDLEIFVAAQEPGKVIVTKDEDFLDLVGRLGPPPQVLLVTCGNSTNRFLKSLFELQFFAAIDQLNNGEPIVVIG
ncbi:MAG: DUF5615 family PIN-like protein [Fimbriimonadaceae bacterium]|nr:DUF5615 family PIN-like protein [Fimbriimonadaceae bacterium]